MYEIYAGERESGVNELFATPKSLHESFSTRLEQHCNKIEDIKRSRSRIICEYHCPSLLEVAFPMKSGIIFMQKQATSSKNKTFRVTCNECLFHKLMYIIQMLCY